MDDSPPPMPNEDPGYAWFATLARTLNGGQSRSVLLHGGVHDLYHRDGRYLPLVPFLSEAFVPAGVTVVVAELNGPVRVVPPDAAGRLRDAWVTWRTGSDAGDLALRALFDKRASGQASAADAARDDFDRHVRDAAGSPTLAYEFLRQLCLMRRTSPCLAPLVVLLEAADLHVPNGGDDAGRMNPADRHRVAVLRSWFGDAALQEGQDSVILLAESRGGVSPLVAGLPQVADVEIPPPDEARRLHFLRQSGRTDADSLAAATAGLGVQALRQLVRAADYAGGPPSADDVTHAVERYVRGEVGEDVVEFHRPTHTLGDVVGNARLVRFLTDEFIPRVQSRGDDALSGAAVAGPIGSGKTFIFEAVAGELGLPVLTLKNLRSQWYGQTDVLFERLRRTLSGLGRVVIFVDEADTAFGGVGAGGHETERRLTGRVQQMMSDTRLRGRVTWLLMTARIHLLSPDIRRPGRAGDLILPVLDPEGDDRLAFLRWMLKGRAAGDPAELARELEPELTATSAAAFASLRSLLGARSRRDGPLDADAVRAVVADYLPPDIADTRRLQTLHALLNTTRVSLLPDGATPADREEWRRELVDLERRGVE